MLFTFESEYEVDTILANTPWGFDKHLMILQKYDGVSKIEDLDFNTTPFWIQIHGLPVKFMNTMVVENLCETTGQVLRLLDSKTEKCGGFMQVKVMVDVSQPLCSGRVVTLDDSMKGFPTFAICMDASLKMTETVIAGLRAKDHLLKLTRNTGHG